MVMKTVLEDLQVKKNHYQFKKKKKKQHKSPKRYLYKVFILYTYIYILMEHFKTNRALKLFGKQ